MEKNDAAEQFYHTYYRLIYRTAKRLCRTQEEQEELIQDSLMRFLKNLAYYTERNSDETSALIVLTMQCQKVDTFRKLHPEKWADWMDEAIEVTASLKREAESRAFRRSEILLLMAPSSKTQKAPSHSPRALQSLRTRTPSRTCRHRNKIGRASCRERV